MKISNRAKAAFGAGLVALAGVASAAFGIASAAPAFALADPGHQCVGTNAQGDCIDGQGINRTVFGWPGDYKSAPDNRPTTGCNNFNDNPNNEYPAGQCYGG